jgi:hypothetical protein
MSHETMKQQRDDWERIAKYWQERYKETLSERDEARAELAKHQGSQFHPDWSLLQTCREELDEARAEVSDLLATLDAAGFGARQALQDVAERQREACAKRVETLSGFMFAVTVRHTPLVTEVEK